jgi:hypothetical protein
MSWQESQKRGTRSEGQEEIMECDMLGVDLLGVDTIDSGAGTGSATKIGLLLGGVGAGAVLMYLLDPERGRTRRARLANQINSKANQFVRAAESKGRHLRNRAQGMAHELGLDKRLRSNQSAQTQPVNSL